MRWSRRFRSSYANVVSTLALCIALGGTSYAAVAITGKDVKNGSLTGKDLKKSSLTTLQVKNRSLLAADFRLGQLPSTKPGPQGPQGAQGPQGPAGPAGESPELFENEASSVMDAGESKMVTAECPLRTVALGGGYQVWDNHWPTQVPVTVTTSQSWLATGGVSEGWTVWAREVAANDMPWKVTAWVSCAG